MAQSTVESFREECQSEAKIISLLSCMLNSVDNLWCRIHKMAKMSRNKAKNFYIVSLVVFARNFPLVWAFINNLLCAFITSFSCDTIHCSFAAIIIGDLCPICWHHLPSVYAGERGAKNCFDLILFYFECCWERDENWNVLCIKAQFQMDYYLFLFAKVCEALFSVCVFLYMCEGWIFYGCSPLFLTVFKWISFHINHNLTFIKFRREINFSHRF